MPGGPGLGHLVAGPLQLHAGPGQDHRAPLGEAALDGLGLDHPAHLADRVDHGPAHGRPGPGPGHLVQPGLGHGEQRRAPAAVAARRPEADHVALDDGDAQATGRPRPGSRRSTGR